MLLPYVALSSRSVIFLFVARLSLTCWVLENFLYYFGCTFQAIHTKAFTGDQTAVVYWSIPPCLLKVCGKTLTWLCFDLQCVQRGFHHRLSHVGHWSGSCLLIETLLSGGFKTRQCLDFITDHLKEFQGCSSSAVEENL